MRDNELCALIDKQCANSLGVDDIYASNRRTAMQFYMGEAKGELAPPEVEGRSSVVSKDLMETVEWAMPAIMEALTGADDVVSFRPKQPGDEQSASDATAYVNHLLYEENEGFTILHDAIKQCLISKLGVCKVWCDESSDEREENYAGLDEAEVEALSESDDVEIVEVVPAEIIDGIPVFNVKAKRTQNIMRIVVDGVPLNEFRISKDARSAASAEFIGHEVERTASQLISSGWPKSVVDTLPRGRDYRNEDEHDDRHQAESDDGDASQEKIIVTDCYIRVDTSKNGVSELRHVVKAGTYIHENEVADDNGFALFTPILMPYRVVGLSMHDLIEDLVRIKTSLMRQVLDNVYLSNTPRTEVLDGQVNLDDLLHQKPGGIVRVKQLNATREIATPFVAGAGLQLLEFADQVRDTRSGVTETNSALNADSLSKGNMGSEGVQALMQAGGQRIRLIARVLAETGIKRLYKLLLKNATQYQDRAAQIQVNGRWLEVNPREWATGFRLQVNVGVGALEKRQQVANLGMIAQMQQGLMPLGLVQPQNVHAAAIDTAKAMGYPDPERYFSEPQQQPQGPSEPPIELQLEQMKQQGAKELAQIKGEVDIHVERMKQDAQAAQAQQETELENQRNAMQMENDMALAQYKVDKEMELEMFKATLVRDTEMEKARMSAEASMFSAASQPQEFPNE